MKGDSPEKIAFDITLIMNTTFSLKKSHSIVIIQNISH